MPPPYGRITRIDPATAETDLAAFIEQINERIDALNNVLAEIALAEARTRGEEGLVPGFGASITLNGNRITDVDRSRDPNDVVTRIELEERGIFTTTGDISFHGPVNFEAGVTTTGPVGGGTGSLITEGAVDDIVNSALEGAFPLAEAGEFLQEASGGENGDDGTPIMGRDGEGNAAFIGTINKQMLVHSPAIIVLLRLILQELKGKSDVSDNGSAVENSC